MNLQPSQICLLSLVTNPALASHSMETVFSPVLVTITLLFFGGLKDFRPRDCRHRKALLQHRKTSSRPATKTRIALRDPHSSQPHHRNALHSIHACSNFIHQTAVPNSSCGSSSSMSLTKIPYLHSAMQQGTFSSGIFGDLLCITRSWQACKASRRRQLLRAGSNRSPLGKERTLWADSRELVVIGTHWHRGKRGKRKPVNTARRL